MLYGVGARLEVLADRRWVRRMHQLLDEAGGDSAPISTGRD